MIAAPHKSSAAAPKRCAAVEVPFELCQFGSFVFGEVSTLRGKSGRVTCHCCDCYCLHCFAVDFLGIWILERQLRHGPYGISVGECYGIEDMFSSFLLKNKSCRFSVLCKA